MTQRMKPFALITVLGLSLVVAYSVRSVHVSKTQNLLEQVAAGTTTVFGLPGKLAGASSQLVDFSGTTADQRFAIRTNELRDRYFKIASSIHRERDTEVFWHENLADQRLLAWAEAAATLPLRAGDPVSEEKAKERLFAIQTLAEHMKAGHAAPINRAIQRLVELWENNPNLMEETGQVHDLRDLMTEWIIAYGTDRFVQDPKPFFETHLPNGVTSEKEATLIFKATLNCVPQAFSSAAFRDQFYPLLKQEDT